MQLPANLTNLNDVLLKLPQQKIARIICALLLMYMAYLLAQFTWLIFPQSNVQKPILSLNSAHQQYAEKKSIDLSGIIQLNLFGVLNEQKKVTEVKVQDAPETKLRLTLSGTVASDDLSIAAAIIENNGKQETYGIGDKITGTRATLENVASDRVLIKQSGRIETLMLDGFEYNKASASDFLSTSKERGSPNDEPRAPEVVDQRDNRELTQSALQLKNDLNEDPGKITDHLKIIPKRSDGNIVGYQLMPGNNPEFFQSSGLVSGDVAVQMNGLDLTIPSEAAQALQALKQDTELSLLVERNGEMTEIIFSIEEQ